MVGDNDVEVLRALGKNGLRAFELVEIDAAARPIEIGTPAARAVDADGAVMIPANHGFELCRQPAFPAHPRRCEAHGEGKSRHIVIARNNE